MKLDLNDLVEHVEKNSQRVTPLEHQLFRGGVFAVGGTAFERDLVEEEKESAAGDRNSTHASIGRIDSALNGNEESWHLLTKRAERGELRQEWVVSYSRVPVRVTPHVDSSLCGVRKKGEVVVAVSKHGSWLEILEEQDQGEKDEERLTKKGEKKNTLRTLGWMLTTHPEFGDLLKFSRGSHTLPAVNQVLTCKEANENLDHEHMVTIDFSRRPRTFRVVSKSWVPVRIKPKLDAHAIGGKQCDEIIRIDAKRGDWVRLISEDFPVGYFKRNAAKAEVPTKKKEAEEKEEDEKEENEEKVEQSKEQETSSNDNKECWMLTVHPEKGLLLQECRADGSDLISKVSEARRRQQQQQQQQQEQKKERGFGLTPSGLGASVFTAADV